MAIGDSAGLVLRIKSEYDNKGTEKAVQDVKAFEKQFQKTEAEIRARGGLVNQFFQEFSRQQGLTGEQAAVLKKNFQELGTVLSGIGTVATYAAGAITAVGAAAVAAAVGIFEIAKQSSDYGSRLFDAQQKTGLMANTLGALDVAAR